MLIEISGLLSSGRQQLCWRGTTSYRDHFAEPIMKDGTS